MSEPYFKMRGEELRSALNGLVKCDVEETRQRFWRWLVERRYATAEYSEHLGREVVVSVDIPDALEGEPIDVAKARALRAELHGSLETLEQMYGPERVAGKRWFEALAEFAQALEGFLASARIRVEEDTFYASHTVGPERDRVPSHTRSVLASAQTLAVLVTEAQGNITTYKDDPLPGLEARKPHLAWLAALEARLALAGFTYLEVADLVPDAAAAYEARRVAEQPDETSRLEMLERFRHAHAERIRKRATPARARIERRRLQDSLASASFDRFKARTGTAGRKAAREWFSSPEYEESAAAIEALDLEAEGGE